MRASYPLSTANTNQIVNLWRQFSLVEPIQIIGRPHVHKGDRAEADGIGGQRRAIAAFVPKGQNDNSPVASAPGSIFEWVSVPKGRLILPIPLILPGKYRLFIVDYMPLLRSLNFFGSWFYKYVAPTALKNPPAFRESDSASPV